VLSPDKDESKPGQHKRLDSRIFNSPNFATCGKDLIAFEEGLQADSELKLSSVQVMTVPHEELRKNNQYSTRANSDLMSPPAKKPQESYIIRRKVVS